MAAESKRWKRIDPILQQALSLPPANRNAFLDRECAGDDDLRREVESLIDHDARAGNFMDSPASGVSEGEPPEKSHADFVGRILLHYRIVEKVGEGGMGVVYRAHDTKLDRDVAIKILPDEFAQDRQRLARFAREAKLLASLNHPNIAAIHGFEEADGKPFLVLELVEGKTLAEKLRKGRLPLEESLGICRQVAEGLEAAHEMGIIHRDLKPSNIQLAREGKVKILDFGLAKALQDQSSSSEGSEVSKDRSQATASGIVLGTAPYMSPEQARGEPIDKRTDIWAFGCVFYECLTGRQAFQGRTVTETLAAILKEEPDWAQLPGTTPAIVRSLLRQCLQKEPNSRLHEIVDARIEMLEGLSEPAAVTAVAQRLSLPWLLSTGAATLVIGLLIGLVVMKHFRPTQSAPVVTTTVRLDPGQRLAGREIASEYRRASRTAMAISRDGRFIVYSAVAENPEPGGKPRLYMRRTDRMEATPINGTEGGISPFLSPDDRWIGFWADQKLKKVLVNGESQTTLCDVLHPFGASWGPDNRIVFSANIESGLFTMSADGGNPEVLTSYDRKREESSHRLPHCLPNGKGVLFTVMRYAWDLQPRVALLESGKRDWRYLLEDAADARYVPTGHMVFLRKGALMAVPFDVDRLELKGQSVSVIPNVAQALNVPGSWTNTAAGQFSISDAGWLAFAQGGIFPDPENSLVWVDRKGAEQPVTPVKCQYGEPRLSPDGRRVLYSSGGRLWVCDIDRGIAGPLTSEGLVADWVWAPDGKQVIFAWSKSWIPGLYRQPADGSSPMERLTSSDFYQEPGSWSPDGRTLAFTECSLEGNCDVLLLDLQSRRVTPFLNSAFSELNAAFSPDGRWLAYKSNESGRYEVYVRAFPGAGDKWQISNEGGDWPVWARSGRLLFYRWKDQVWIVDVQTGTTFSAGKPRLLLERPGYDMFFDVSPDSQRLLMVKLEERKPQPFTDMILIQNWFEELKRLAPTGRK